MKKIKKDLIEFLKQKNFVENLQKIHDFPSSKTINALISLFYSTDEIIKDRAITSLAEVVSKIAEKDIELARKELKQGKTISHAQLKKELGLNVRN